MRGWVICRASALDLVGGFPQRGSGMGEILDIDARQRGREGMLSLSQRGHDYFAGSMILYSSRFGENDSMFKCEDGNPEIELHEPPHNLTELAIVSGFSGCKKELSKLYIDLKHMVDRGSGTWEA